MDAGSSNIKSSRCWYYRVTFFFYWLRLMMRLLVYRSFMYHPGSTLIMMFCFVWPTNHRPSPLIYLTSLCLKGLLRAQPNPKFQWKAKTQNITPSKKIQTQLSCQVSEQNRTSIISTFWSAYLGIFAIPSVGVAHPVPQENWNNRWK